MLRPSADCCEHLMCLFHLREQRGGVRASPSVCAGASGAAARVAASLAEDKRSWRVPLPWFESGQHRVSLFMDGAQVRHAQIPVIFLMGKLRSPLVKTNIGTLHFLWVLRCSLAGQAVMM